MSFASQAISSVEADALFAPLLEYRALLLAVSGGVDSMALLELIAEWRQRRRLAAPMVSVATVDHQLRREARAEAECVAARCAELGLEHAILTWRDAKPASGLANAARDARYRLLHSFASALSPGAPTAVVTAHTQDDQAETLVMRLARGSGVDGLAAMAPSRRLATGSQIMLVRSLLTIQKDRLTATLTARGVSWCEDPSNTDAKSERVRVRRQLMHLRDAGVAAPALALSARRLGEAQAALAYADVMFTQSLALDFNDDIFASVDRAAFDAGPSVLRQRALARLITRFGGDTPRPSLSEIEGLTHRLASKSNLRATLGGAVVLSSSGVLKVWREAGRIATQEFCLAHAAPALWDRRFWLSRDGRPEITFHVRPLGRDGAGRIAREWTMARPPPVAAIESLPSIWAAGKLIAAPALSSVAGVIQFEDVDGLRVTATPVAIISNGETR